MISRYEKLFSELENTLKSFVEQINNSKLSSMATDEWTVKDVMAHVTFWHQYYARQYAALAEGKEAFVFTSKGGSTRNQEGVNSLKHLPRQKLEVALMDAQKSLRKSILVHKVSAMDYTDRKRYKTEEFLEVVIYHIRRHTDQLSKVR